MSLSEAEWAQRFRYTTHTDAMDWPLVCRVQIKALTADQLQPVVRTLSFGAIATDDLRSRTLSEVHHAMCLLQACLQYVLHGQQYLLQHYNQKHAPAAEDAKLREEEDQRRKQQDDERFAVLRKDLALKGEECEFLKHKLEKAKEKVVKAKAQRDDARGELVRVIKEARESLLQRSKEASSLKDTDTGRVSATCQMCSSALPPGTTLHDHLSIACPSLMVKCKDCGTKVHARHLYEHVDECQHGVTHSQMPPHVSWGRYLHCSKCNSTICPTDLSSLVTWATKQHEKVCSINASVHVDPTTNNAVATNEQLHIAHQAVPTSDKTVSIPPLPPPTSLFFTCTNCNARLGPAATAAVLDAQRIEHEVSCEYHPVVCPNCTRSVPRIAMKAHLAVCSAMSPVHPNTESPTSVATPAVVQTEAKVADSTKAYTCPNCQRQVMENDRLAHAASCPARRIPAVCDQCGVCVSPSCPAYDVDRLVAEHKVASCAMSPKPCARCGQMAVLPLHEKVCQGTAVSVSPKIDVKPQLGTPTSAGVPPPPPPPATGHTPRDGASSSAAVPPRRSSASTSHLHVDVPTPGEAKVAAKSNETASPIEPCIFVSCKECGQKVGEVSSVEMEKVLMRQHELVCEGRRVQCHDCGERVKESDLMMHGRLECPFRARVATCPSCGTSLGLHRSDASTAKSIKDHQSHECPDRMVECQRCQQRYTASRERQHQADCVPKAPPVSVPADDDYDSDFDVPPRRVCEFCGREYTESSEVHVKECEYMPLDCDVCNTKVVRKNMTLHKMICGSKKVKCERCGLELGTARTDAETAELTERHARVCDAVEVRCGECGMKYLRGDQISHDFSCAGPSLMARCPECDTMLGEATSVAGKQSMIDKHLLLCAKAPMACAHCSQTYLRADLVAHEAACEQLKRRADTSGLPTPTSARGGGGGGVSGAGESFEDSLVRRGSVRSRDPALDALYQELAALERGDSVDWAATPR
eukprot:PhM_4_TR18059/c0_g1_i1/m.40896